MLISSIVEYQVLEDLPASVSILHVATSRRVNFLPISVALSQAVIQFNVARG